MRSESITLHPELTLGVTIRFLPCVSLLRSLWALIENVSEMKEVAFWEF
jgi:hypothetical protein